MKETELRQALSDAIGSCQLSEYRKRQVLAQMKGEQEPVKKKLSVSLAVVLAVMILTLGAAIALFHSNIADNLYPNSTEAPEELLMQIQTPQQTAAAPLGSLTLDELLYDGHALHTSITVENPTEETLLYTVDGLTLGGLPLDRTGGNLLMEGAGSAGLLLGGSVEGTALPRSCALYNEAANGHLFDENGSYLGTAPIPEGKQTLCVQLAVWRPLNSPKLVNYRDYEGEEPASSMNCLVTDENGRSELWLFRPKEADRSYNHAESGAEAYREVFQALGWAELVDIITLEAEVELTAGSLPQVRPTGSTYLLDGCTLTLTGFEMSHAGGQLTADLTGSSEALRKLLSDGLHLVDRAGRRLLSNGSWWSDIEEGQPVHLTMPLCPLTGGLPSEVWLAPVLEMNPLWDPAFAGPDYDPAAPVPEDAVSIYRPDYARGVCIPLETE